MRRMLAVLGGLLAVSMWVFAAEVPADKKFETKQGTVMFSHSLHEKAGAQCSDCHHSKEAEGKPCSACHTKDSKVKLFNAIHGKICKDCHAKQAAAGKKTPKACNDCHKKAA